MKPHTLLHHTGILSIALALLLGCPVHAEDDKAKTIESSPERLELQQELSSYLKSDASGQRLSAFVQAKFPKEVHSYLQTMIQNDPDAAKYFIKYLHDVQEEYQLLLEEAPEEAEMRLQIERHESLSKVLSEQYTPGSDNSEKLAARIKAEITAAFDLKLKVQKAELEFLENEVTELRELMNQRTAARDQVIQRRLDELTGKRTHMEW
ncbi:MAG: hypothetical protein AAF571_14235 [Verrucomicrobiota bacterium]